MRATDWEFRNRVLIFGLVVALSYPLYIVDRSNVTTSLASSLAAARGWDATATVRGLFALVTVVQAIAALVRTWASAYLHADVVYASQVKSIELVADGPYRRVRNPLYLGVVLMAVAIGSTMSQTGCLVGVALTLLFCYRLILREEDDLLASHGERYEAYLAAVPRFWPARTPRLPAAGATPQWTKGFLAEAWFWGFALAAAAFAVTLNTVVLFTTIVASLVLFRITSRTMRK